jgi:hypothetical protein
MSKQVDRANTSMIKYEEQYEQQETQDVHSEVHSTKELHLH